jgi:hypothetical protein
MAAIAVVPTTSVTPGTKTPHSEVAHAQAPFICKELAKTKDHTTNQRTQKGKRPS